MLTKLTFSLCVELGLPMRKGRIVSTQCTYSIVHFFYLSILLLQLHFLLQKTFSNVVVAKEVLECSHFPITLLRRTADNHFLGPRGPLVESSISLGPSVRNYFSLVHKWAARLPLSVHHLIYQNAMKSNVPIQREGKTESILSSTKSICPIKCPSFWAAKKGRQHAYFDS